MLKVAPLTYYGNGPLSVSGTATSYALMRSQASSYPDAGFYTNNVIVRHIDVSVQDPAAVVLFSFGRRNVAVQPDTTGDPAPAFFRGNISANDLPNTASYRVAGGIGFTQTLGQYFVTGQQPFQLDFLEGVECLRHPSDNSETSQAFTYITQRVDSDDSTEICINVWFDEY